jgi:hypothetical protein
MTYTAIALLLYSASLPLFVLFLFVLGRVVDRSN